MQKDSAARTILVAIILCIICSLMVTSSAVFLRDKQTKNKQLDIKKNLLLACGLLKNSAASEDEINEAYISSTGSLTSTYSNINCEQITNYGSNNNNCNTGTGNINSDPLFVNTDSGDYRLNTGSPAIDAGYNYDSDGNSLCFDADGNFTDLDGNPRCVDIDSVGGDSDSNTSIDMGAYEYQ